MHHLVLMTCLFLLLSTTTAFLPRTFHIPHHRQNEVRHTSFLPLQPPPFRLLSSPTDVDLSRFYSQKCSDEWHCDTDGCWVILGEDGVEPAVESKINTGTNYGEHVGECAITGSVGIDDNKIASIIDASPVTWDASECLLVFNDENDTDDYTVVCNLTGDDLRDWKDLLSENEKVMFTSGMAIPKMN
ncbi:hypothetical protein TrLO_g3391 [Triparma laevis f. longispina]|uniref:Uncharacterized protein n=1 Tax=Triparma laevis f. longispina TaxID=1714387 RepID=A0A9W7AKY0_9STRA|nr:hypothetical protein TrLO_g3391 [Triparma laevis f. longispina]